MRRGAVGRKGNGKWLDGRHRGSGCKRITRRLELSEFKTKKKLKRKRKPVKITTWNASYPNYGHQLKWSKKYFSYLYLCYYYRGEETGRGEKEEANETMWNRIIFNACVVRGRLAGAI